MQIGVPREIKEQEYRVGLTPFGVKELVSRGHNVIVEDNAGIDIDFTNEQYHASGALIVDTASEVYDKAELIVKVKEPQVDEYNSIKENQILFCYLHLAASEDLVKHLVDVNCIAIAYETITSPDGSLPLLTPMSEVAGKVAVQVGAHCLHKYKGGRGVLLGGVPGVMPGNVAIIGGGIVGANAAQVASGMGANVTILERSINNIRSLNWRFGNNVRVLYSSQQMIEESVRNADLLIGAVLVPGNAAPMIVTKEMVKNMKKGSVIVDVSVDQGGCVETIKPTTHDNPFYEHEGVIHYGVTNMPSAVAHTSTIALENVTLPYIIELADLGYRLALKGNKHFRNGLNIYRGRITHEGVAKGLKQPYTPCKSILGVD